MNYGETLAYWYLRLNGFFLLNNFVVHRTPHNRHSSDIDLLGIRMPYVFEEVGGQENDWDNNLTEILNPDLPTGVICEVKTGTYKDADIFQHQYLRYAVNRFGFMPNLSQHSEQISGNMISNFEFNGQQFQILKLLISNRISRRTDFMELQLNDTRNFINQRIQNYQVQKWQDRVLFQCDLLEDYIDRKYHEENE